MKNEEGEVSSLNPKDLLPSLELLGQNEILEIEKDAGAKLDLIHSFLPSGKKTNQNIDEIKRRLSANRQKIVAGAK